MHSDTHAHDKGVRGVKKKKKKTDVKKRELNSSRLANKKYEWMPENESKQTQRRKKKKKRDIKRVTR